VRVSGDGLKPTFTASGAASVVERGGAQWLQLTANGASSLRTSF
jgi:hypothetical protein